MQLPKKAYASKKSIRVVRRKLKLIPSLGKPRYVEKLPSWRSFNPHQTTIQHSYILQYQYDTSLSSQPLLSSFTCPCFSFHRTICLFCHRDSFVSPPFFFFFFLFLYLHFSPFRLVLVMQLWFLFSSFLFSSYDFSYFPFCFFFITSFPAVGSVSTSSSSSSTSMPFAVMAAVKKTY